MKRLPFVNPLMGTASTRSYSNGNLLPLTSLPFGMVSFTPETRADSGFLVYHPSDRTTTGIRLTHSFSPWLPDYATLTLLPTSGEGLQVSEERRSGYRPEEATVSPERVALRFLRYRTSLEITPTLRGGMGRVSWDSSVDTHRLLLRFGKRETEIRVDYENRTVSGYTTDHHTKLPENFKMYFVFRFDSPPDRDTTRFVSGEDACVQSGDFTHGEHAALALGFAADHVTFRFATSYISPEQALLNLNESACNDFDLLCCTAGELWESYLSKIDIETANAEQVRTFYTCMYRAFLFPRTFHEISADGEMLHYSPTSGEICRGPLYTDSALWDTYRTLFPLYSILIPDRYAEICEGFLNFYRECGWLPRCMAPCPIDCMPGTAIDAILADAAVKGVISDRAMLEEMLEALCKHAEKPSENKHWGGRDGIEDYLTLGYVSLAHRESVNKTLDYAYGDFCIAQIAKLLGHDALADDLLRRSKNYENLFDAASNLMKACDRDGKQRADWTEFRWGLDYTEGSAWQNSFAVPHDVEGLAKLMGGAEQLIAMIDRLFALPPIYDCSGYGTEIHEMTEMAAVDFGQCALSNQPSFHIPYIYSVMNRPDKTAYWVRRAVRELFSPTVDGFPGDEDTGSMAAWYIFSVLGIYPFCPGKPEYTLGSPSVTRAVIHTGNGTDFEILAPKNTPDRSFWNEARCNGMPLTRPAISHEAVILGGSLEFDMKDTE
ncbi:MAG: hypothetical protein E7666_06035 [Ruminococcaceae bacterium]|nr:hypothetical protein [Oscillospiraceae bacterium]